MSDSENRQELQGRVALVTGAMSGIGRATALKLAHAGAFVAVCGRREDVLNELVKEIVEQGGQAQSVIADLATDEGPAKAIKDTISAGGRLDILVNSAGIISMGNIETTTMAAWDEMMHINLRSVFELMNLAVPYLTEHKGNIVNVSSVTGLRSFPGVLAYCVSKAAVDQLTRCSALELADKGVRVNAVNPGVVVTNLHKASGMAEENYQAFLERSKTTHPIGRVGSPEEVAELIYFLASDRAGWITGATYSIDGGRALTCAR